MSDDSVKMTRADLYDWIRSYGCEIIPLPEHKANIIHVKNPKNGHMYWINLPIDERLVRDFTVFKVCNELCIPVPTHATYMKSIHDDIENEE